MNQILQVIKNNHSKENDTKKNNKKITYKTQFISSIFLLFFTIISYFIIKNSKTSKEQIAKQITNSYSISKLYNNKTSENKTYSQNGQIFTVIGMIEIPKIDIYYPIISESNDELLKISPCRIAGPMPNENGNLCIAGHNYDNYKFFSQITNLTKNDEIKIYNIDGTMVSYSVYEIYEVLSNNLSPLEQSDNQKKQVTLITCNNFSSNNRIIVKAYSN